MKCTIDGCPGGYEERMVTHTVRHHGRLVVFDHVPAEVCSVCGDVLFKPETVRRIESLLASGQEPAATVPMYEYAG
jgi:YgiT-type zinc finger domain-containing protein